MVTRPYLRPEFLRRIPLDGITFDELGDVILKVSVALDQLTANVKVSFALVDLIIGEVLEQHFRERDAAVEPGPVAGSRSEEGHLRLLRPGPSSEAEAEAQAQADPTPDDDPDDEAGDAG
jgi:hypothetical protein